MIHVIMGTKAQTIKMAPVMRALRDRGIAFRLVDTGQHGDVTAVLRQAFDLPEPDVRLAGAQNIGGLLQGMGWALGLLARAASPAENVRRSVFGGQRGLALVHGDNATTALAILLARRAGLRVALVEAGLLSHSFLHPFPEEILRTVLPHLVDVLFPPSEQALSNLRRMKVRGRIVPTHGNTVMDSVRLFLGRAGQPRPEPFGLWNCHRIENLFVPGRLDRICHLMIEAAARGPVRFVVDVPTRPRLEASGWWSRLEAAGVEFLPLMDYPAFLRTLARCRYAATDGGTIQEECAVLGVPCLLLRRHTERQDGLGANAVLAGGLDTARRFLAEPDRYRRPPAWGDSSPSGLIADELAGLE